MNSRSILNKSKKYFFNILILLFSVQGSMAQYKIYSPALEKQLVENHNLDSLYYPTIIHSKELVEKLNEVFEYPEQAINQKLEHYHAICLSIDTEGNVKQILPSSDITIFDSSSIKFINATNGHWKPAFRKEIKKEVEIGVLLIYSISRSRFTNQIYYSIEIFGTEIKIIDSTDNSPASILFS